LKDGFIIIVKCIFAGRITEEGMNVPEARLPAMPGGVLRTIKEKRRVVAERVATKTG
jgi:hypothetical protein